MSGRLNSYFHWLRLSTSLSQVNLKGKQSGDQYFYDQVGGRRIMVEGGTKGRVELRCGLL